MPARPQATCYPSAALSCVNITRPPMCLRCNSASPYMYAGCCTSSSAQNNITNVQPCSVYCVTLCNTVCVSLQAYCSIGKQQSVGHSDMRPHPNIGCTAMDEIIMKNWTAKYWNELIDNIETAEQLGKTQLQGAAVVAVPAVPDVCNNTHPANSLITAEKYNQIRNKIARFNIQYPAVVKDDVIKSTHAIAIKTAYAAMKFNTNVCDICNSRGQTAGVCSCNCACACSCSCGCPCPCSCDCSCSCDCACSCSCDCSCSCSSD